MSGTDTAVVTLTTDTNLEAERARSLTDRIKVAVEGTWQLIAEAYTARAWVALGYSSWDDYTTREFGTSRLRLPKEHRQEVVGSLRDAGMSVRAIASATGDSKNTVARALAGVPNGTGARLDSQPAGPAQLYADAEEQASAERMALASDDAFEAALDAARADGDMSAANVIHHLPPVAETPSDRGSSGGKSTVKTIVGIDGKTYTSSRSAARRPDLPHVARSLSLDLHRVVNRLVKLREDDRLDRNGDRIASLLRAELLDCQQIVGDLLDALSATESISIPERSG